MAENSRMQAPRLGCDAVAVSRPTGGGNSDREARPYFINLRQPPTTTKNRCAAFTVMMSFGFGVGYIIAVLKLADEIRERFNDAPEGLKTVSNE
jgi:hypothetical protein